MCGLMKFQVVRLFRLKQSPAACQNRREIFHRQSIGVWIALTRYLGTLGIQGAVNVHIKEEKPREKIHPYSPFSRYSLFSHLLSLHQRDMPGVTIVTETVRGKIEMDLPDAPVPKVEIDLDKNLLGLFINFGIASNPKLAGDGSIDLSEYTAYAEMLKGASIRAYDQEMKDLDGMVDHYQGILENEKWEHLVKIRDKFDLSLLYGEKSGIVQVSSLCSPMMAIRAL